MTKLYMCPQHVNYQVQASTQPSVACTALSNAAIVNPSWHMLHHARAHAVLCAYRAAAADAAQSLPQPDQRLSCKSTRGMYKISRNPLGPGRDLCSPRWSPVLQPVGRQQIVSGGRHTWMAQGAQCFVMQANDWQWATRLPETRQGCDAGTPEHVAADSSSPCAADCSRRCKQPSAMPCSPTA